MQSNDDSKLTSFLNSIESDRGTPRTNSKRQVDSRSETRFTRFAKSNWMSMVLLFQVVLIIALIGSLIAYPTRIAAIAYFILLLVRWLNYPLVVSALFHDDKKWLAVVAGALYTVCSLTGRLWTIAH